MGVAGWLCLCGGGRSVATITRNCVHQSSPNWVCVCSDHLQLIKFWPSRALGKWVCGGAKIFGFALLQPARSVCVSLNAFFTGRMPLSGKLPVLDLLTGRKSGFSPRRGDSLHRFRSNFAGPTGTWVSLAVQIFTSIGAEGGNAAPKYQKFPLFW